MRFPVFARWSLLAIAALSLLAIVVIPASATITPVNSAVTATSSNANLTDESNGLRTRCPLSTGSGRTSADGRSGSGTVTFTSSGGVTCTESLFGSSVRVACSGNVTLRSTSSVAGASISGTAALDSGFSCTITPAIGSARTIRGPQTPANCFETTIFGPSTMRIDCRTIAVDGGGESGFAATYTANRNFTVS